MVGYGGALLPYFGLSFLIFLAVAMIWELIWKGIALWKAARNKDNIWFIFILVLNTLGILPIIYIAFFSKKKPAVAKAAPVKKAKRRR